MSSIILNGDTSGSVTVSAPSVAGTQTVTLPAASGSLMVSGNMPAFQAYQNSTSQTVPNATVTKIQFNSKTFDTANCFDNTTNYRFTPNVAGYYQLNCSVSWQNPITPTGECQIILYKNGGFFATGMDFGTSSGLSFYALLMNTLVYANGTTDYFEIYVYQASGASKNVYGSNPPQTYFNGFLARSA
jgi:hypothetical protein